MFESVSLAHAIMIWSVWNNHYACLYESKLISTIKETLFIFTPLVKQWDAIGL